MLHYFTPLCAFLVSCTLYSFFVSLPPLRWYPRSSQAGTGLVPRFGLWKTLCRLCQFYLGLKVLIRLCSKSINTTIVFGYKNSFFGGTLLLLLQTSVVISDIKVTATCLLNSMWASYMLLLCIYVHSCTLCSRWQLTHLQAWICYRRWALSPISVMNSIRLSWISEPPILKWRRQIYLIPDNCIFEWPCPFWCPCLCPVHATWTWVWTWTWYQIALILGQSKIRKDLKFVIKSSLISE